MNVFYYLIAYVVLLALLVWILLFGSSARFQGTIIGTANWAVTEGWILLSKVCGHYGESFFRWLEQWLCERANPLLMYFYVILILGGYGGYVYLVYPFVNPEFGVSELHKYVGALAVAATFTVNVIVCRADSGKLTMETSARGYVCYPHDALLYRTKKFCQTCKLPRPARTRHCRMCGICVLKHDHHCPWINQCVGEGNYRWFLAYLASNAALCGYATVMTLRILFFIADKKGFWTGYVNADGVFVQAGYFMVFQRMMFFHTPQMFFVILCGLMGVVLVAFVLYHLSMAVRNVTTAETFKISDLKDYLNDNYSEIPVLEHVAKARAEQIRSGTNVSWSQPVAEEPSKKRGGKKGKKHNAAEDASKVPVESQSPLEIKVPVIVVPSGMAFGHLEPKTRPEARRRIKQLPLNPYDKGSMWKNLHEIVFPPTKYFSSEKEQGRHHVHNA